MKKNNSLLTSCETFNKKRLPGTNAKVKAPQTAGLQTYYKLLSYSALTLPLLFAITSSAILFGAGA